MRLAENEPQTKWYFEHRAVHAGTGGYS
ncbi:protein of unknown function [Burkholderia multivorans]